MFPFFSDGQKVRIFGSVAMSDVDLRSCGIPDNIRRSSIRRTRALRAGRRIFRKVNLNPNECLYVLSMIFLPRSNCPLSFVAFRYFPPCLWEILRGEEKDSCFAQGLILRIRGFTCQKKREGFGNWCCS